MNAGTIGEGGQPLEQVRRLQGTERKMLEVGGDMGKGRKLKEMQGEGPTGGGGTFMAERPPSPLYLA